MKGICYLILQDSILKPSFAIIFAGIAEKAICGYFNKAKNKFQNALIVHALHFFACYPCLTSAETFYSDLSEVNSELIMTMDKFTVHLLKPDRTVPSNNTVLVKILPVIDGKAASNASYFFLITLALF